MRLLATGVAGKVGAAFLRAFLAEPRFDGWAVVAICNQRVPPPHPRLTVMRGSIADDVLIEQAMRGATHVLHMAAVKESPSMAIDIAVKGMFVLLEAARRNPTLRQFITLGGDCSVGHIFQRYDAPITEDAPRKAYPGCYALTKVIEEEMLVQYQHQYDLNGCCLRMPWIMDRDDFRFALHFGPDQFGGPAWTDYMSESDVARHAAAGVVPLMRDHAGAPLLRNFVHVSDVVTAILAAIDAPAARQQLFNIAMDRPVDYAQTAAYLHATRGMDAVDVPTPHFGNWLDNSKARQLLGWQPAVDLHRLVDEAWNHVRPEGEKRITYYPG